MEQQKKTNCFGVLHLFYQQDPGHSDTGFRPFTNSVKIFSAFVQKWSLRSEQDNLKESRKLSFANKLENGFGMQDNDCSENAGKKLW